MKTIENHYWLELRKEGHLYYFKFNRSSLKTLYWELINLAKSSEFNVSILDAIKLIHKISVEFKKGNDSISFSVEL